MQVSVVSAVYNEEKNIGRLIESLLSQTRLPDEIVLVDDGSQDATAAIIEGYAQHYGMIRLIRNSNQGPAVSRNMAWRAAQADIVIFTDGDCVPNSDWVERLLAGLISQIGAVPATAHQKEKQIGAVAGTYRTLNDRSLLARFIGLEIAWRYRNVRGEVDAHGSYNLAIRKPVLEEMGGFEESYKAPSGEDWDLTYRISRKYKILFVPEAIVAHTHPEAFWPYMKNQVRRGLDRIKLYNDHPEKRSGDTYTGGLVKYQVLAAGLLLPSLGLFFLRGFGLFPAVLYIFLCASCGQSFGFIYKRDPAAAFYGVGVQFCRCFAWAWGALKGVLLFGFKIRP